MARPRRAAARGAVLVLLAAAAALPARGADAAAPPEPPLRVSTPAVDAATSCDPGVDRADEVALLVHGTSVTADESWGWSYREALPEDGWATCAVTLPDRALGDIQVSSEYVVAAIRSVTAMAGHAIDVIGISQGGLEVRWALRWWPEVRALVDDAVLMATPNHGAVFADASCATACLPALWQARTGSAFLRALNRGDETPGPVDVTSVFSALDPIIQPATTAPLAGASNIALQDLCPNRVVEHAQMALDAAAYAVVLDALRHRGAADPRRVPRGVCSQVVMPHVHLVPAARGYLQIYALSVAVQALHPKVDREPALAAYARSAAPAARR